MEILPAGVAAVPDVLKMIDRTIEWLVSQGRTGQWGSTPRSENPQSQQRIREMFEKCESYHASNLGYLCFASESTHPDAIPSVGEEELFIHLLITDREKAPPGTGKRLVNKVIEVAHERNIKLVRVECYGGNDQKLVRAYESMGFKRMQLIEYGETKWPMQVLEMRL